MVPRVTIVPNEDLDKATLDAIAEVSQQANGAVRVKMHDKHAALVSLGKHLGLFVDRVPIERKQISAEPMSAEEWKRQFVREANELGMAAASGPTEGARRMPAERDFLRRHARRRQDGWRARQVGAQRSARALIVCDFKEMGRLPMAVASARFRTIQMCPKDLVRDWRHSRPQGR